MTPSFLEFNLQLSHGRVHLADLSVDTQKHFKAQRIAVGDSVVMLDGLGQAHLCLLNADKTLSQQSVQVQPALKPEIHLVLSPPKGDALAETICQATEIGIAELSLFYSDHCQWTPKMKLPFDRLQRISDQACSQSCRAHRMAINPVINTASTLKLQSAKHIVADEAKPGSARLTRSLEKICLWIGPEGGWSDLERQFFGDFAQTLTLGSLILRVPTAVVAATQHLKDLHA